MMQNKAAIRNIASCVLYEALKVMSQSAGIQFLNYVTLKLNDVTVTSRF